MKVLVADDSREMRELLHAGLSLAGFSVTVASNGVAALRAAPGQDAIVTDIDMPGMTGVELIQRIRSTGGDTIPIVVVTGLEDMQQSPPTGASAVLGKPFDLITLVGLLSGLLSAMDAKGS
jgi:CheY-like chemotaxis protein